MNYYELCCQHKGQVVQITEKSGKTHVGTIENVDRTHVWMAPVKNSHRGFGYGYPGPGYGPGPSYGPGPGYGPGQAPAPAPAYGQHGYSHYSYGHHGYGYSGYGGPYGGRPGYAGAPYGRRPGFGPGVGNPNWVPVALAGVGGFALGSAFFW